MAHDFSLNTYQVLVLEFILSHRREKLNIKKFTECVLIWSPYLLCNLRRITAFGNIFVLGKMIAMMRPVLNSQDLG